MHRLDGACLLRCSHGAAGAPGRTCLLKEPLEPLTVHELDVPTSSKALGGRSELARRHRESAAGIFGRDYKPYDLRKTFRTMLSRPKPKVDGNVAGLCLNHTEEHGLRTIYDSHDYWDEMVDAWERAGAHIDRLRTGGSVIVPLARPRATACVA